MKSGIILATHGALAKELLNTSRMFMAVDEKIPAICYMPEHAIDTLLDMFQAAVTNMADMTKIIIFCDIKGGSPCNVAMRMAKTDNRITVISGVNIPVLLETLSLLDNQQPGNIITSMADVLHNSIEILNKE